MSCNPIDPTALDFLTHFQAVEDPRRERKVIYLADEILTPFLCAVIPSVDRLDLHRTLWPKES